jgi:lipid II:glycine glycyltransferase (peptidoglycan interpeptide bridge formation enzyme)
MINYQKHPLQSRLWGEFRKKTGIKVVDVDDLLITIHPIPHSNYTIGYLPKGPDITKKMLDEIYYAGKKENCIFVQIEPNVEKGNTKYNFKHLYYSAHPLFTNFTFILDLTKSEEELLKNMHPKTRYNIKLAQKKGVKIAEDNSDKGFNEYLKLTKETTTRQGFFAHSMNYHKLMWETLRPKNNQQSTKNEELTAHLLTATFNGEVLVTWILFVLNDTLYYPYGASSSKFREVMASNLMMWETIKFGKKMGLKKLDMWGALGPDPDKNDPWYGFHKFKEGYGARHVEFVGSFDFVINKRLYNLYKIANKIRWILLRLK